MAFLVAKQFSLTLVLISLFLSSSHARESQYFSKVRATTTNFKGTAEYSNQQVQKTEEQAVGNDPSFYKLDAEKPHGLYAASPPPAIDWSAATRRNDEYDDVENYENSQLQRNEKYSNFNNVEEENRSFHTVNQLEPRPTTPNKNYKIDSTGAVYVPPYGMSDTRYLENGRFFYDVDKHEFSYNHPYEVLKATNRNAQFNSYSSSNSENKYNSMEMNDQDEEGQLYSDMP